VVMTGVDKLQEGTKVKAQIPSANAPAKPPASPAVSPVVSPAATPSAKNAGKA